MGCGHAPGKPPVYRHSKKHADLTGIAAFRSCRTLRKMCEFVERPKDPAET